MPTILQINTVVNTGSTGRIAEELGQFAIKCGWNSYIAYGREDYRKSSSVLIKIGTGWSYYLHALQTRLLDRHGLGSIMATKRFLTVIDEISPDIIHIHNIHGYYLNYQLLFEYFLKKNIPIIWTLHDCWSYTGHCGHYSSLGCFKWKNQCSHCPDYKGYPKSWFVDRSYHNYKDKKGTFTSLTNITLVPVSSWLQREVMQSFLSSYPTKMIYNGVDVEVFTPNLHPPKLLGIAAKFVMLSIATVWSERKGLKDLIHLAKLLPEDIIILVGLKESQMRNLPSNIIGVSRTDNVTELVELYSFANLYVSFSVEETFGLTIAESLSCGTPALVYNRTACPEVVSKETGFIVSPHNFDQILCAIETVKQHNKSYYSRQCRQRAVDYFNKNDRYQDYMNLYNSVL